jgi:single-stranded-DNA-specific exonuclease
LHAEDPNRLLVTVDCGISCHAEAALARELGLELIITDHHTPGDELPPACLVHPRLPGSTYPFDGGELCGAGVAFKLAWGVCQRLGDGKKASPRMREFLKSAVGLAAIATVADVVPLLGENRVIVRYGLSGLLDRPSPGLRALFKAAGLDEKDKLHADDVAFAIAPRINAAGRLGQARLAVELLTTDDESRAGALADYLGQLNDSRNSVERKIFRHAKEMVAANPTWSEHAALVLAHAEWHPGVIGIVAARVAEHFERPAILISLDAATSIGQGSGRSFAGFDLYGGLARCAHHLESFGGHRAAAGLRISSDRIDDFRSEFCRTAAEGREVAPGAAELSIDAEVRLADVTRRAVGELERIGPFGCMNSRPLFAATQVELVEPPRKMGEGDRHLALRLRQFGTVLRAVAFGRGDWADEIGSAGGTIAVCFAPGINRFRGTETVELQLIDWQPETAGAPAPLSVTTQ